MAIATAILFLLVICVFAARGKLPPGIAGLYLTASLAAAVAYRVDKSAAQSGRWRTSERTLHVLALLGGWPGALIGQRVFRHKSRKPSFRVGLLATVGLNLGALLWFLWATSF